VVAETAIWGLIPAAGSGRRMGSELPKQYLQITGSSVLEWSYRALAADARVQGIVVCIGEGDQHWAQIAQRLDRLLGTAPGGPERCHSVLNGLAWLLEHTCADDWVLVHDAARPCLLTEDLLQLINTVTGTGQGGLLAVPLADTLKRADSNRHVVETVERDGLWRAMTPQMFRIGELHRALFEAIAAGVTVTDEAAAMERTGQQPLLVPGSAGNIKITRPEDLELARWQLEQEGLKK